jgi:branched-chain amino acid transport system substrate-binding protein
VAAAAGLVLAACGSKDDKNAGPADAPTTKTQVGDGVLKIGTLFPQTGSLVILGPPQAAGVKLALKDINAAGGVLGKNVEVVERDSGDDKTDIANISVDSMLNENVDAIVGAAASAVTLLVIDKVTGSGVLQVSASNTSTRLSTYQDKGLFFRTAPSDVYQGRVVGETAVDDGAETLAILARQDAYGTSLADQAASAFTDGGGEVKAKIIYNTDASEFTSEVSQLKTADPDAIALIGFEESSKIIDEMLKQGILPLSSSGKKMYFVDGNMSNTIPAKAGSLEGIKGTIPGSDAGTKVEFQNRLKEFDANLKDYSYAAEAYDATMLIALATELAKSDTGRDIAAKLVEVSSGGEKCTTFAACKALIAQGKDFDYDGLSGPIEFDVNGDPTVASMGIYQFGSDNKYKLLKAVSGSVTGAALPSSTSAPSTSSPSPSSTSTSSPEATSTSSPEATSTSTSSPSPTATSSF